MAGEIAYKLTAEEKQAIDAIRKVAEAFSGVEGGIKKVSEETRKAQQEQAELGRLAKRIMEDAKTPAEKYAEQMAKLEQLYKDGKISLGAYKDAANKAHDAMAATGNAGVEAFGQKALGMVRTFAGALGLGGGIAGALQLVVEQYRAVHNAQQEALQTSLPLAAQQRAFLRNYGPKTAAERDEGIKQIEEISRETSVRQEDVYATASEAVSARGSLPVKAAFDATRVAALVTPDSPEAQKAIAGGILDIQKVAGGTAEEVQGFLLKLTETSRVVDPGEIAKNAAPAISSAMQTGASLKGAAALWSSITQGAVDPTGRRSKTAAIQLSAALEEALPAGGEVYSELQYQKDKQSLERQKKADEQRLQRAAIHDPEYLRQIQEIKTEKASLPRLKHTADRERKALEEAQTRVGDSPQFRDMEAKYAVMEKELTARRTASTKVISTGFHTQEDRIAYLQSQPEARAQFWGKFQFGDQGDQSEQGTKFYAAARAVIGEILSGKGQGGQDYREFQKRYPSLQEAAPQLQQSLKLWGATPLQGIGALARGQEVGKEELDTADSRDAAIAKVREHFFTNLVQSGEGAFSAGLGEKLFNAIIPEQQLDFAKQQYRRRAELLRGHDPMHGKEWTPTPGEVKKAEALEYSAASIEKWQKAAEEMSKAAENMNKAAENMNKAADKHSASKGESNNRSTLGSRRGDPGDRH
jgi:hypothetical protein